MEAQRPVVLVVEDEPLLRMNTVDMVEDAGFPTLEAANANRRSMCLNAAPMSGSS